jgi:hypothetical protein
VFAECLQHDLSTPLPVLITGERRFIPRRDGATAAGRLRATSLRLMSSSRFLIRDFFPPGITFLLAALAQGLAVRR